MWLKIESYDRYEVSDEGEVRSLDTFMTDKNGVTIFRKGKVLKQYYGKDGYLFVHLSSKDKAINCSVARLVCTAFHQNPNNLPQVDHIDGNKTNNAASNLRWVDAKGNKNNPNTKTNGLRKKGEYHHSKETKDKISLIMSGRPSTKKGIPLTDDTKKKISENRKGKIGPHKAVLQYDLDGNYIKEWVSISKAIEENKLKANSANSSITRCCQGKLKQACGYIWKYKDNNIN